VRAHVHPHTRTRMHSHTHTHTHTHISMLMHACASPHPPPSLKVVATVACGAAYVTGRLAALVGDASYALALKIAKALPGHSERRPGVVAGSGEGAELAPEERTAFKTVRGAGRGGAGWEGEDRLGRRQRCDGVAAMTGPWRASGGVAHHSRGASSQAG
jgi:hypothetical protein